MGELVVELAGTPAGDALAFVLAILSALAHAVFGAINKGGTDPFVNRGAINLTYGIVAAPFALFVVPWPSGPVFTVLLAAYFIHIVYEWFQASAFKQGAFTVVYPIARGTGPLVTAVLAIIVFSERMSWVQWGGLMLLSGSIFLLAGVNYLSTLRAGLEVSGLRGAIFTALLTGVGVAAYTTVDAYGIRLARDPFTFIAWFFFMGGFGFPIIAWAHWRALETKPAVWELTVRGIFGALIAFISFGSIMLATRLGAVAEAAALRETSIIFAIGIGVLIFKEKISAPAVLLTCLIAAGAIIIETG